MRSSVAYFISNLKAQLEEFKKKPQETAEDKRLYIAKCRLTEAEAGIKELDLEVKKGQLIALSEVLEDIESSNTKVKVKLEAIPSRLALELSGMSDPSEIEEFLSERIQEILEELSSEFIDDDESDQST